MESTNEQAARWAVRADSGPLGPTEQQKLDAWLSADPGHLGAYVRARAQWVDLDRLAALHGPARPIEDPLGISRRQLLAAGVAAVTVVGGGLTGVLLRGEGSERYVSGIGEIRRIALEDGSTLLLNTATEVAVKFGERERAIRLIRGEALFEVAHDKARPFLVHANDVAVRAVGTAFAVRLEAAQVDITVTEGVVEVASQTVASEAGHSAPRAPRTEARRVAATERIVINRSGAPQLQSIAPVEADRQLAWRDGLVSFDGESLQTAVAEINRHNRRQIIVNDPVLAGKPVVGVFRATDLDGFSAAAAVALKATATPDGDVIRLQSRAAQVVD
jgi:transmembrane sensor